MNVQLILNVECETPGDAEYFAISIAQRGLKVATAYLKSVAILPEKIEIKTTHEFIAGQMQ